MTTPPAVGARPPFRAASPWRSAVIAAFVAVAALVRFGCREAAPPTAPSPTPLEPGVYEVEYVVDGDTLQLIGGARIRLLGVDTPETVAENRPVEPWGPEASDFTRHFIDGAGKRLRLSFDHERFDRFGRHLGWAWHGETSLNEELVRAGMSPAVTKYPYSPSMKDRLRAAEREAKREQRGLWSQPSPQPN